MGRLRDDVLRLTSKVSVLELEIFQLRNPFKFKEGQEVFFFNSENNIVSGRIFHKYWGNEIYNPNPYSYLGMQKFDAKKKYYKVEIGSNYSCYDLYKEESELYTEEEIKQKFSNIKEQICGNKTIRRTEKQTGKKRESKSKN